MDAARARPCPAPSILVDLAARGLGQSGDAELEEHVASCNACRAALVAVVEEGSVVRPTAATPPPSSGGPRKRWLGEGDVVGRYRIARMLGKGGMGVVYEATDPKLRRAVALKLLLPRAAVTEERLLREAQALAQLNHPNVVTVFDTGIDACGVFVAMELVLGPTLREYVAAPERTREDVLRAFVAAGRGLAAAHERGLVHRDFKPDNVLVGPGPRFVVTDFGLAVAPSTIEDPIDDGPPSEDDLLARPLTKAGHQVGTPAYMAPEQRDGRPVDARANQYGFAVALAEAMTGHRPTQPDDLSSKRFAIGPRLEETLRRALAQDRAARFDSLEPVLAALEAELSPPRSRATRAAFVAIAGAIALGIGAFAWSSGRARPAGSPSGAEASSPSPSPASADALPAASLPSPTGSATATATTTTSASASAPPTLSPLECDPKRHPGPCPPWVRYVDPGGRYAAVFVGPPMIEKHGEEASPVGTRNVPTLLVSIDTGHTMSLVTVDTANLHGLDCRTAIPVIAANLESFLDGCRVTRDEPIRQGTFLARRYTLACPKKPRARGEVRIACDARDIESDRLHVYRLQAVVEGERAEEELALLMDGLEIF